MQLNNNPEEIAHFIHDPSKYKYEDGGYAFQENYEQYFKLV